MKNCPKKIWSIKIFIVYLHHLNYYIMKVQFQTPLMAHPQEGEIISMNLSSDDRFTFLVLKGNGRFETVHSKYCWVASEDMKK